MKRVIDTALLEVGYLEKASLKSLYSKTDNAGKGNYTKYAKEMMTYSPGIYANGHPWCDTFVDWCFVKAYGPENALRLLKGWSAYTPTSASYYKNYGRWFKSPNAGDQIFFVDSKGTICHTGLVYAVDESYVYTVEGNTSSQKGVVANGGAVEKKYYRRDYSRIAGYGRPEYLLLPAENKIEEEETVYNTIDECPAWSKPYVAKAIELGYIKGNDKGELGLNDTKIWCITVIMRITGVMT